MIDKIKAALKGHGELLEQDVLGKLTKLIGEPREYAPNGNGRELEAWWELPIGNNYLQLFLEVKQHGEERNVWLFKKSKRLPYIHFHVSKTNTSVLESDIESKNDRAEWARVKPGFMILSFDVSAPDDPFLTDKAFMLSEKLLSKDSKTIEKETNKQYNLEHELKNQKPNDFIINKAVEQLSAVLTHKVSVIFKESIRKLQSNVFMSMIVTNAKLMIWNAEKSDFQEVPWLIHEHSINNPEYYIKEYNACGTSCGQYAGLQTKLSVFIVNDTKINDFMGWLMGFLKSDRGRTLFQ